MRLAVLLVLLVGCGGSSAAIHASTDGGGGDGPAGDDGATPGDDAGMVGDAGGCTATATPAPGVVVTDRGAVQGKSESGTWAFLGIPYAAPPVGALRWQ
ncbi:MAG TPA: carboxylesterase family protein, partial [Polyangiaceae bacterium]|nr:carboxylesterase family protein [Polyangiaceae bacterium]